MSPDPATWFVRAAAVLLPSDWRAPALRDLLEEAATRRWGAIRLIVEVLRVSTRLRWAIGIDAFVADLRLTLRSLVRAKGFTAAAVLTFGLGIGANVAVFTLVDRLLFRSLPYNEPHRLVQLHLYRVRGPGLLAVVMPTEVSQFLAGHARSFDGIGWSFGLTRSTVPAPGENPLILAGVTANTLQVLGLRPALGRDFVDTDIEHFRTEIAVLLSHDVWQGRFAGSDDVLSMRWNGYHVVGVLPAGFLLPSSRFFERIDGVHVLYERSTVITPGVTTVAPFARLRPGVSVEAAQAEVDAITAAPEWASASLKTALQRNSVIVQPLQSGLTMLVRPYLWLVSGAVWIVLLAACVNLATLFVARGRSREHEQAIRLAVGASRSRLVGLAVIECLVICAFSSVVALLACASAHAALVSVLPPSLRGFAVRPLEGRIVAVTVGAAFASAVLTGFLPAIRVTRTDVLNVLQRRCRSNGRLPALRSGAALLAVQAAFGVALVVGALITVPGFVRLLWAIDGFEPDDLYVASVNHGQPADLGNAPDRLTRVRDVGGIVSALPHVERGAAALMMPIGVSSTSDFWARRGLDGGLFAVTEDMFATLGTPIRAGRTFSKDEVDADEPVAIVNVSGVGALWPGVPPNEVLGRSVETEAGPRVVVGVVSDIRSPDVPERPMLFLPVSAREVRPPQSALQVAVRMAPGAIPDRSLWKSRLDAGFGPNTVSIRSVSEQLTPALERPRFLALLFGVLCGVVLLLAAIGLHAVASFEVARRRHEIGIRLALGASPGQVRRRIYSVAIGPVLLGAAFGLLATWLIAASIQTIVGEVQAREPAVYLVALALMLGAAVLTVWHPARRAAQTDPAAVLRES
jgi:predicted permease